MPSLEEEIEAIVHKHYFPHIAGHEMSKPCARAIMKAVKRLRGKVKLLPEKKWAKYVKMWNVSTDLLIDFEKQAAYINGWNDAIDEMNGRMEKKGKK